MIVKSNIKIINRGINLKVTSIEVAYKKNVGANLCVRPLIINIKTCKYLIKSVDRHIGLPLREFILVTK